MYRDLTHSNRDYELVVADLNNVAQPNILPSFIQRSNVDPLVSLLPESVNHGCNCIHGRTDTRNPKRPDRNVTMLSRIHDAVEHQERAKYVSGKSSSLGNAPNKHTRRKRREARTTQYFFSDLARMINTQVSLNGLLARFDLLRSQYRALRIRRKPVMASPM